MTSPDVLVSITGGVADVTVHTPGIIVEVRDYDVDGTEGDSLWTDEDGARCVRYFTEQDPPPTP